MNAFVKSHARWFVVVAFAVAMAWLESATVYYLRTLVDRIEPYQPNPLPIQGVLGQVELIREAATLLMLVTVGCSREGTGAHGGATPRWLSVSGTSSITSSCTSCAGGRVRSSTGTSSSSCRCHGGAPCSRRSRSPF